MVTRTQMDTAGRLSRKHVQEGDRDKALAVWLEALAENYQIWRWHSDSMEVVRNVHSLYDGSLKEQVHHIVTWRRPYVQGEPEYTVTRMSGGMPMENHTFNTALAAALFIGTGRDTNAKPLSYLITVHEEGKAPEVEPLEVVGIEEALDRFAEEMELTRGRPVLWERNVVRSALRAGQPYSFRLFAGPDEDGPMYRHTIEKM